MTIQIPDTQARVLLTQLPDTPEGRDLRAKIEENMDRSRTLTADELDAVVHVVASADQHINERSDQALQLRTALPKLRAIYARQRAREQGRG